MLSFSISALILMLQAGTPLSLEELQREITEVLERIDHPSSQISFKAVRLKTGESLIERSAETLLVPASLQKLFTTAAALDKLGTDHVFKLELFADSPIEGTILGDLTIRSDGDPWLIPERVWYVAQRLKHMGIRRINGDILVDGSAFEGPHFAAGMEQDESSSSYMAPAGALSVGFNSVLVHVYPAQKLGLPAAVVVEPRSSEIVIQSKATTSAHSRSRIQVDVQERSDGKNVVDVSGQIPLGSKPLGYWRRITRPDRHAGAVFVSILEEVGIEVNGIVKSGTSPKKIEPLASFDSPQLLELATKVNHYSNNFMAEQLVRALGAASSESSGTWSNGEQAMQEFTKNFLKANSPPPVFGNASGLHDVNKVSTAQTVELLRFMWEHPLRYDYLTTLPVSGRSGTLASRFENSTAIGKVRAKTGTLSIASGLAGYAFAGNDEPIAFAFVVNYYQRGIREITNAQEEIAELLTRAEFSPPPPEQASNE